MIVQSFCWRGAWASHPDLATQLSNRGEALNALGQHKAARESFERAQLIWERELGPENLNLGYALTGLGVSYLEEGRAGIAIPPLKRHQIASNKILSPPGEAIHPLLSRSALGSKT